MLIGWFPDRRGMATGMAIMGFGWGVIIGVPLIRWLLSVFREAAEYLGADGVVALMTEGGGQFAQTASGLFEVVFANAAQVAEIGGQAGIYVVGAGNTGAAGTFVTPGIVYLDVMTVAAFQDRIPREGWQPAGWTAAPSVGGMVTRADIQIDQALRTPQFWLLWIVLCFKVTGVTGVIGVAKRMINEIFGNLAIVTASLAGSYVLMISAFNMVGRFLPADNSDYIGRKNIYHCFFVLGMILYLSVPLLVGIGGTPALIGFYAATMIIFKMYGGGIQGRLLTAWPTVGVLGPLAILYLRDLSRTSTIEDLATRVDPAAFAAAFGAPVEQLGQLVSANTVTIARLMDIVPAGTVDPTSTLYNTMIYVMAALLVIAFFANLATRSVRDRRHVERTHPVEAIRQTGAVRRGRQPAE